jgi:hypothetical protein
MENVNAGDLMNLASVILFLGMVGTVGLFAVMGTRAVVAGRVR